MRPLISGICAIQQGGPAGASVWRRIGGGFLVARHAVLRCKLRGILSIDFLDGTQMAYRFGGVLKDRYEGCGPRIAPGLVPLLP
jgi:hypothetical protein